MLDVGLVLDDLDGLPAVGGADDLHLVVLEQGGEGEDVAGVVVDDQHLASARGSRWTRGAGRASCCFASGRSATTRWRKRAVSSRSRSGDCTSLSTMLLAMVLSRASSSAERSLPVKTTTGTSRRAGSACTLSSSSKPLMSGSRRSSTQQSNGRSSSGLKRLGAGGDGRRSRCRRARAARRWSAARSSLSSTTSSRLVCGSTNRRIRSKHCSSPSVVVGFTR